MKYPREVQAIPGTLNINALTGTIQNFSQVGIAGDVTGGSAKLYVNGNVGIGTTGPGAMLDVAGTIRASGEITGTMGSGYGQFRMVSGNYGAFFRNDGSNTYLLLTNSGDQYGQWNSLRPIYVSNSDGTVYFGNLVRGATYGFGGMWTWQTDPARCGQTNPFTGGCSCPSGFTDKQLPGSLGCAGNDCTQLHYCYK